MISGESVIGLDPRLISASSLIRRGSVVADVGCDHGYLSIYLIEKGICERVIASDINDGPISRARKNVCSAGLDDRIAIVKSDGLKTVMPEENGVTDICICGMGGETISKIIEGCGYTKHHGVRLILQPMTKPAELREFLLSRGFSILDEVLSESRGHIYTVILAEYANETVAQYTPVELLIGRKNIEKGGELYVGYVRRQMIKLKKQIKGMTEGGLDVSKEKKLFSDLEDLLK